MARRLKNFALVHHSGRSTGKAYATPVNYFRSTTGSFMIALTYGPDADWVCNVLATGSALEVARTNLAMVSATIVGRNDAWASVPRLMQPVLRLLRVHDFTELELRHGDSGSA